MNLPSFKRKQLPGTESETDQTTEIPIGSKIFIEYMRVKDSSNPDDIKRIISGTGNVGWRGEKKTFVKRGQKLHFIEIQTIIWDKERNRWKIQIDENWCEALKNGKTYRSKMLSIILRDDTMVQLINIASNFLPIQITRTMAVTATIFAVGAGLFVLALAPSFAPTTVVHWLSSPPKVLP